MRKFAFLSASLALAASLTLPLGTLAATSDGPTLKPGWTDLSESSLSAKSVIVLDAVTGKTLYTKNPDAVRSAASLSKIMTSVIFLEQRPVWDRTVTITEDDEVGGGRLQVPSGTKMTNRDLLYSALVGSANNAAMSMMRNSGLSKTLFVDTMNVRAAVLGMGSTHYNEPSGMDPENVTTARDMSKLVRYAFANPTLQKAAQTMHYRFSTISPTIAKDVKSTNSLLLDPDNGLWIMAGKTGYLDEAQYNLAIRVRDMNRSHELVVVTLGADTKQQSFDETEKLAKWAWQNYVW